MRLTEQDEVAASNYARDEFGDKVNDFDNCREDFLAGVIYLKKRLNEEANKEIHKLCEPNIDKRHEYVKGLSDAWQEVRKVIMDIS